jgi:hypothetical protein
VLFLEEATLIMYISVQISARTMTLLQLKPKSKSKKFAITVACAIYPQKYLSLQRCDERG